MGILEAGPLGQKEVDALLRDDDLTCMERRMLLTVRDRERQRDETLESFNTAVRVGAELGAERDELQRQLDEARTIEYALKLALQQAEREIDALRGRQAIDAQREADSTKYSTKASSPSKGDTETSTRTNG